MEYLIDYLSTYKQFDIMKIKDIFNENKEIMKNQIYFEKEVENIKKIYDVNINSDFLVIPNVYDEYTIDNSNIIVMDFIEGMKLTEINDTDKDKFSYLLAKFSLKSVLLDRVYHGDLHQGNIIFIKNQIVSENKSYFDYKLGIIDFGIIGTLTKHEQDCYYKFFTHFFNNKFIECTNVLFDVLIEPKEKYNNLTKDQQNIIHENVLTIIKIAGKEKKTFNIKEICEINKNLDNYKLALSKSFVKLN